MRSPDDAAVSAVTRVLVSGGTGFIGQHLVQRLISRGDEVALVVRDVTRVRAEVRERCLLISAMDVDEMRRSINDFAPGDCYHLAAVFTGAHRASDVTPMIDSNITLGTHMLEALAGLENVRFASVGTLSQHYGGERYHPATLYAATKQAFADVLRFYAETSAIQAVTIELGDTYGAGDERGKLLPALLRPQAGADALSMSPGAQLVDFTHVDDVIEALHGALGHADHSSPTYSVCSGSIPLRRFVELVAEATGVTRTVDWGVKEYRPREMMTPWGHFPLLPGWNPKISLREGLMQLAPTRQPVPRPRAGVSEALSMPGSCSAGG